MPQINPHRFGDRDLCDRIEKHTISELRRLSTPEKINAIKNLMRGGWLNEREFRATKKICESVVDPKESYEIQISVDPFKLADVGQRSAVLAIFIKLPPAGTGKSSANTHYFYHGAFLTSARDLVESDLIEPYSVPPIRTLEWFDYTDFGKGLYVHFGENKKLALKQAKRVSERKGVEWGIARFTIPDSGFARLLSNRLLFSDKKRDNRPPNAPRLFNNLPANWIEFVEHNRKITTAPQRPGDNDWTTQYSSMQGPLWTEKDSPQLPQNEILVFPDHIHQVNLGLAALEVFNDPEAKTQRRLFHKHNEHLM